LQGEDCEGFRFRRRLLQLAGLRSCHRRVGSRGTASSV
jgi:hypothetical protein